MEHRILSNLDLSRNELNNVAKITSYRDTTVTKDIEVVSNKNISLTATGDISSSASNLIQTVSGNLELQVASNEGRGSLKLTHNGNVVLEKSNTSSVLNISNVNVDNKFEFSKGVKSVLINSTAFSSNIPFTMNASTTFNDNVKLTSGNNFDIENGNLNLKNNSKLDITTGEIRLHCKDNYSNYIKLIWDGNTFDISYASITA